MVCLIFTSVPPTVCPFPLLCGHRLSPPVRGRDILIDGLYILCVCSVFAAGGFEFFFLACLCHVSRVICSSFLSVFSVMSILAYVMLVNTGSRKLEQLYNSKDHSHISENEFVSEWVWFFAEFIALAVFLHSCTFLTDNRKHHK